MSVLRLLCAAYLSLLTAVLLVPDPRATLAAWLHLEIPAAGLGGGGTHFVLFAVLALMAHGSRLPVRPAVLTGLLAVYAIAMETLQVLLPPRSVEMRDYIENLLGLGVGTAAWCLAHKRFAARCTRRE